ncbi:MAG TPA: MTH1187 family thiamine-binding protein [Dehalococcoidia bacterium]|nr:MTH1187 family thiamine-binding protein [Dehalococcoidia bacterium]
MAVAEITVIPSGVGPSVSAYVAKAERVIQGYETIKSRLTPMGTILEGELDDILAVVKEVHNSMFSDEVKRVYTIVRIDERRDKPLTMDGKLQSVEARLSG